MSTSSSMQTHYSQHAIRCHLQLPRRLQGRLWALALVTSVALPISHSYLLHPWNRIRQGNAYTSRRRAQKHYPLCQSLYFLRYDAEENENKLVTHRETDSEFWKVNDWIRDHVPIWDRTEIHSHNIIPSPSDEESSLSSSAIPADRKLFWREDSFQDQPLVLFVVRLVQVIMRVDWEALCRSVLRRLAELSLDDYAWRNDLFQNQQAERSIKTALARMLGKEHPDYYVRPMDAPPYYPVVEENNNNNNNDFDVAIMPRLALSTSSFAASPSSSFLTADPQQQEKQQQQQRRLGPLGRLEAFWVEWLLSVYEEENQRARSIIQADGHLVRPKDIRFPSSSSSSLASVATSSNASMSSSISSPTPNSTPQGPLGRMEQFVVDLLQRVQLAERERVRTHTLRPKDMEASQRGPLGDWEQAAVQNLRTWFESETLRAQLQSQRRDGDVVRPMDVPGPLGDWELAVSEMIRAEQLRVREAGPRNLMRVRPKDAKMQGPLGRAELKVSTIVQQVNQEEWGRLQSIRRYLQDHRPMETDRKSPLGALEALFVGLARAPQLFFSVLDRVKDLLQSEQVLSEADQGLLEEYRETERSWE